jgi:hypothetical protein
MVMTRFLLGTFVVVVFVCALAALNTLVPLLQQRITQLLP